MGVDVGHHCTRNSFEMAIRNGNVKIVEWLFWENNITPTESYYCMIATEYGHLNVLKFLHKLEFSMCDNYIRAKAAGGGHLDVLIWLNTIKKLLQLGFDYLQSSSG
jgi:hypothetical protein